MISRRQFINSLLWTSSSVLGVKVHPLFAQRPLASSPPSGRDEGPVPLQYQTGKDVRYTTEVGGFFKAIQLFRRFHRAGDEQDLGANCQRRKDALDTEFAFLKNYLANVKVGTSYKDLMGAHETLAQFYSYTGEMTRSIEQFQAAYNVIAEHQLIGADLLRLRECLGIAEMRRGESDNCVQGHAPIS